jgi:hypothetical protein
VSGTRNDRVQVSISVRRDAHDELTEFCSQQGVNMTTLLEQMMLAMGPVNAGELELPSLLGSAVVAARREAVARRTGRDGQSGPASRGRVYRRPAPAEDPTG